MATANGTVEQGEVRELAIAPVDHGALVQLVAQPEQILANWKQFQALKQKLLDPGDYQPYNQSVNRDGRWITETKQFIKKSGWRKIGSAFGISLEELSRETVNLPDGAISVSMKVRAVAPGGHRHSDGLGACDSTESRFWTD